MEKEFIVARDFLGLRNRNAETKSGRDLGVVKEGESRCPPNGLHLGSGSMAKECMFGTQVQTESDIQQREDLKRYINDRVCLANMALQQPYSNKTAALQQFMTFKNLQEERSQKGLFSQLATPGVQPITTADAFDLNNKIMAGSQKSFGLDPTARSMTESGDYNAWQNGPAGRHFGVSRVVYPSQVLDDQGSSVHHIQEIGIFTSPNQSLPISNVCSPPLFKGQQASSTSAVVPMVKPFMGMHFAGQRSFSSVVDVSAGTTVPRATPNVPGKPGSAQLTIFYAGTVNVYEDVPADKAEAIMFLAGSGSSWSGKISNSPTQSPAISIPVAIGGHSRPATPVCQNLSNSLPSMNPQAHPQKLHASILANQSTTISSSAGDFQTGQNGDNSSNHQEGPKSTTTGSTPTPIVPRVPQARKASLTRFLEKRKERVCSKAPYPTKKSLEDSSHEEKSLSPKRCYTPPPVDGCGLQHCEPVGDGLNGKFVPKREDSSSCLERDHNKQPWSLKFEKDDITECKLQLT